MSALILIAAAAVWATAKDGTRVRIAAGLQTLGVVVTLALRGDVPPAGWASVAVIASWLPALLMAARPAHLVALPLARPQAVLTAIAAVWAATAPGPGVAGWTPWAWPHIVLATLGLSAAFAVGLLALRRLRGAVIGPLICALALTALPLATPKAAWVHGYHDGAPATIHTELADPNGGTGIVRDLPARVPLPLERPLRAAAALAILLTLMAAIVRWAADRPPVWPPIRTLTLALVGLHAALLVSAAVPRDLGVDRPAIEAAATETIAREAIYGQSAGTIVAPDTLEGGLGAPALPLSLALAALGLLALTLSPAPSALSPDKSQRVITGEPAHPIEGRFVGLAVLLLAGAAVTGMAWSNFVWGGPAVPDPRLYATIVVLGLYTLYFMVAEAFPNQPRATAWVALAALAVLLLTMVGPELGWLAPTLHHFGA